MKPSRIVGIAIFALGAMLLAASYHASNAPIEQLSDNLTGHFSDHTTWQMFAGVAAAVIGALLATFGPSRR